MGSANNIIHPTRLREIGSSVRRFERVMMSVSRTEIRCRWNQAQASGQDNCQKLYTSSVSSFSCITTIILLLILRQICR